MRIGVDVGGTKIEGIALEGADVLFRHRVPAPRGDYDATIRAIGDMVAVLRKETGRLGTIGVGIPGAISRKTGVVKNANSTWIIGRPIALDLERAIGQPVRVSNDA